MRTTSRIARTAALLVATATWLALAAAAPASAQAAAPSEGVQLDFDDVELPVVIDTIAQLTGKNFIYDDRVRGRVTIVSPTKISVDEAYAVFESVLQVKGFTTVDAPGGAIKVIPIREAKESNVETLKSGPTPVSDRYVTRLIPLQYIDADAITQTLKPLVSNDASMVAYAPTNTVILTDAATNISRILSILRAIDVETYKEELTVVQVQHADASTLAEQLSDIFEAEVSGVGGVPTPGRVRRAVPTPQVGNAPATGGRVRIITDERTNSLVILASRQRMKELREVIARLDVAVSGGGRIHVYYLKHADAEEMAKTLDSLIKGAPSGPTPAGVAGAVQNVQALRAAVTELSEGVTVTADPPTNSLVIQASQEGFKTLSQVIDQLDIPRPQVLVEALIMEVDITDTKDLGFSGIVRIVDNDNRSFLIGSLPSGSGGIDSSGSTNNPDQEQLLRQLLAGLAQSTFLGGFNIETGDTLIQGLIRAAASLNNTNILSAPHILTLDNEPAEIKVGDNIPIVTSRVQSAAGITADTGNLATSTNIERQDIGITLKVTPQISEGDSLRLEILQEITAVNQALSRTVGFDPNQTGPALSNRKVENTVVVADNETVVIGGLIGEQQQNNNSKVPWLGDIPVLGWLFKSTSDSLTKTNLLIFLTPHIVRSKEELAHETIRKREEFWASSSDGLQLTDSERKEARAQREKAEAEGIHLATYKGKNPVRARLMEHRERYPVEQMREIELELKKEKEQAKAAAEAEAHGPRYRILAATFGDEGAAAGTLQELIDAGYDGDLVSEERSGTLLYEIRVGPYDSLEDAENAAHNIGSAFGLSPSVVVESEGEELP